MILKKSEKTDLLIKNAFIEDNQLTDVESGEIVNLNDLIFKIYGTKEVKISVTASNTEELDIPSTDDVE